MDPEIFYVLVGSVIVAAFARRKGWPAPLLVTVIALAVSFIPAVPNLRIDGHVLLNLVLPPLLYSASLDVSFVSFRRSMPQIRRLGIGLVVVTTAVVGLVAWLIMPSLTLPGALLLGAIVAPPDAVSAAAIGRKLGLPRRIMTVLSGESLINDATSLTLYRVFAAIVAGATVSLGGGIWQFVVAVVVGIAFGVVAGFGMHQLRMRISDPVVIGTFGLLAPFGVYAITEHLDGSGVLAVVAMGLVVGYNAPRTSYATRMQEAPIWLSADFLLESFVFAYIGLQLPPVITELGSTHVGGVLWLSAAVLIAVLLVRPLFVYPASAWGAFWSRLRLRQFERSVASGQFAGSGAGGRGEARAEGMVESASERGAAARAVPRIAAELARQRRDLVGGHARRRHAGDRTRRGRPGGARRGRRARHRRGRVHRDRGDAAAAGADAAAADQRARRRRRHRRGGRRIAGNSPRCAPARARRARSSSTRSARCGRGGTARRRSADSTGSRSGSRVSNATPNPGSRTTSRRRDRARRARAAGELVALSKGWLQVRRDVLIAERDAGELNEEVMRELIAAMDAEELALDTRLTIGPGER